MVAPFHSAESARAGVVETRGEPNSATCQRASNPSAVTVDVTGSTSMPKLGVGQDERMVASSSLPPYSRLNEVVPRRLMLDRNEIVPAGGVASTLARAATIDAAPQARSSRSSSRHVCQAMSAPLTEMRSSERSPVRLVVV